VGEEHEVARGAVLPVGAPLGRRDDLGGEAEEIEDCQRGWSRPTRVRALDDHPMLVDFGKGEGSRIAPCALAPARWGGGGTINPVGALNVPDGLEGHPLPPGDVGAGVELLVVAVEEPHGVEELGSGHLRVNA
jgi:hypothetical protein